MSREIRIEPLSAAAFAPFGDVLEATGAPDRIINQGMCGRYHDQARLEFDAAGHAGVSIFEARPRALPYRLEMLERHPLGAQCFVPMTEHPFLVIAAPDQGGLPGRPQAFLTAPGQAVNYHRNVWHGVLTPLAAPGLFAVVDRIGPGENLQEHWLETPWSVSEG